MSAGTCPAPYPADTRAKGWRFACLSFRTPRLATEKPTHRRPGTAFFAVVKGDDMVKKATYGEQLKHPKWQRARLERLDAAGWKCEKCGETEKTLHVHHERYVRGRMPWEYTHDELEVLCEDCHATEHGLAPRTRTPLQAPRTPADRVLWLLMLKSGWWITTLRADYQNELRITAGWHGEAIRFIERQLAVRGQCHWAYLREQIAQQPWGEAAIALVDNEDPAIKPLATDLLSTVTQIRASGSLQEARFCA